MKISPVLSIILGLSIAITEAMSFAATPKTPEVYTATESTQEAGIAPTGSQIPVQVPVMITAEAPLQAASHPILPGRPALASVAKAPDADLSAPLRQFDAVPLEQVEPFLKRMRLVEELLEKYGRAYDYRIHTVRDLEGIRARLEADARMYSSKSTRVAPAVPAVPLIQNAGSDTRDPESSKPDSASGI